MTATTNPSTAKRPTMFPAVPALADGPLPVGLHLRVPAVRYHADPAPTPSLSSGLARTILARSLAHAHAEHPRLGGTRGKLATAAMDTGTTVHAILSGTADEEIEVGEFDTFRSKAAQQWAEQVEGRGKLAVLEGDLLAAHRIADAIRIKAALGTSHEPFTAGHPEVTAIWERNGCHYRARYDRLETPADAPWTAWDWKVTSDVGTGEVIRKFIRFRYHLQAAHYLAGMDALCPAFAGRHSFVFVFAEDAPPYSVRRYCLHGDTLAVAAIDIAKAHRAWERAMLSGDWPDATRSETTTIEVPTYDDEQQGDEIATRDAA